MKDIFDECSLGDLKLKSRIIRTGTWERQTEDGGFLKSEVFDRYEKMTIRKLQTYAIIMMCRFLANWHSFIIMTD